jgi:RNA polymerase sigma-70 factor (ECF subfamily)
LLRQLPCSLVLPDEEAARLLAELARPALPGKSAHEKGALQMPTTDSHLSTASSWNDEELLQRMLRREELAWREFQARFGAAIEQTVRRVTAPFARFLQPADHEEIVATFFCELTARDMHKLRRFDASYGSLGGWATFLARRTAWDYVRLVGRRAARHAEHELNEVVCDAPDPLRWACAMHDWQSVKLAINDLTERDRTFVDLLFVQGRSSEQIAEQMSIALVTVHSKKHKIRSKLASALHA